MAQSALRDGRLADAADALDLPLLEVANVMRGQMGFETARPQEIHRLLTQLGPQRFITTNYDTLIEQQLGLEGRLGKFRTVTATRVAEMADILKASADHFIFKPHGDIGDAATMVLSARDYERIMLGGQNLIRQGLETLLVSRPVLFLGFGLRDPDLNLILRSLTDSYHGNIHHLYAIVADLSNEERDYWWRRFKIRAFGYSVRRDARGRNSHEGLAELLKTIVALRTQQSRSTRLRTTLIPATSDAAIGPKARLARYAAGLIRDITDNVMNLRGRLHEQWSRWPDNRINHLHGCSLQRIIEKCPVSMILVGGAGSGKSHAFSEYLSNSATRILSWLAQDQLLSPPPIPVLLDTRSYNGSFDELLQRCVPEGIDLKSRSEQHRIDFIIDSIDEMPQQYLEGGVWRHDLGQFVTRYRHHRLIYGSRRSELVGDPATAAFYIDRIDTIELKHHLMVAGLDPDDFVPALLEDVTSPFLLSLILEFGRMVGPARSIAGLLECAIRSYLERLPDEVDQDKAETTLRFLAHEAVMAGRETITIPHFLTQAETQEVTGPTNDSQRLLEGLVRTGLLVSEIESQVRFVHRSVTEYLCSSEILSRLAKGDLDLAQLLKNRRWDDPIIWALSTVDPDDARKIFPLVYEYDPALALRIVRAAEQHHEVWWQLLLSLIAKRPPTHEALYAIKHEDDYLDIPPAALPKLRELALGENSEIRSWAWLRYAKHASYDELARWLDEAAEGSFGFGEFQWIAPTIGEHLGEEIQPYFRSKLAGVRKADEGKVIELDGAYASDAAHCYATLISGLQPHALEELLRWSSGQSEATRAIICSGVQDVAAPAAYRYLLRQLDRRFLPACFPLYLGSRSRHRHEGVVRPIPRFTANRLAAFIDWMGNEEATKWSLHLLQVYLDYSSGWRKGVRQALPTLPTKVRKAIRLVDPDALPQNRRRFVLKMLENPATMDELDRAVMQILADAKIALPEEDVLAALAAHGLAAVSALQGWLGHASGAEIRISAGRMNEWIDCLGALLPRETWPSEVATTHLFGALARAWSFDGRDALLRRANDPLDPMQDFILAAFVLRLTGFSMAEVSMPAAARILDMYLDGEMEPYPSPGDAATDEFIDGLVMLRAETELTEDQRESIEQIFYDAGGALGRRFHLSPRTDARRDGEGYHRANG